MSAISARAERSYIAGIGASGALVAAATVAAVFLLALVAFNGWPTGGSQDVASADAGRAVPAAQAASAALAPAPTAVAAAPAPVTLASAGNPNSIVTDRGVGGGNGGSSNTGVEGEGEGEGEGGGGSGLGAAADEQGPVSGLVTGLGLDNELITPLAQSVDQVGSGLTQLLQSSPQIVQELVPGTVTALGTTVNALGQTVNGLLGQPQGTPVPTTPPLTP